LIINVELLYTITVVLEEINKFKDLMRLDFGIVFIPINSHLLVNLGMEIVCIFGDNVFSLGFFAHASLEYINHLLD
jgi:hypothetical protein